MPFWNPLNRRVQGDAAEQFHALSWGHDARTLVPVVARHMKKPQRLVALGKTAKLRRIYFENGTVLVLRRPFPWIAVGEKDNRLYFVGGSTAEMARRGWWGAPGSRRKFRRTDYEATKGRERVYWFHDHEKPYPTLRIGPDGFPIVSGGRYRVERGGIVG